MALSMLSYCAPRRRLEIASRNQLGRALKMTSSMVVTLLSQSTGVGHSSQSQPFPLLHMFFMSLSEDCRVIFPKNLSFLLTTARL